MDRRTRRAARVARTAGRVAAVVLSATVLVTTGYGWTVAGRLGERVATSDVVPVATTPTPSDAPFTALLVGLDSRTDNSGRPLPSDVLAQLHAGEDEGQLNTDTIILLHVPGGPKPQAVAISFPRDSFVEIAGAGRHKINTAYRRGVAQAERAMAGLALAPAEREQRAREGGRRELVATLQQLTGIRVDHFAEVNLAGFVEITDVLGGVPVCLNAPVREARSGIDLPAGQQVVRGPQALAFVRQRHGLDDGDLDRIGRQQAFLAGLTSTVMSSSVMRDPARFDRLTQAVGRYVVLDRGWSVQELVGQLRRVAAGELQFETIPTGTPALDTPVDGIAVQVDPDEVRRFVQQRMPEASRSPLRPSSTPSRSAWALGTQTAPGSPQTTSEVTGAAHRSTAPGPTRSAMATTTATTTATTGRTTARTATTTAPPVTAAGVPCVD